MSDSQLATLLFASPFLALAIGGAIAQIVMLIADRHDRALITMEGKNYADC